MRQTPLLLAFASALYSSTVVDRIAVIVGKHVIKSSDIYRDLGVTEFLNREQPNFGSDAKHKSAERLIDQAIIGDEITNGAYTGPADADGDVLLKQLRQDRFAQRQFIARDGSKPRTVHKIVVSQCHVIAPLRSGNKAAESAAGRNAANGSVSTGAGVENDWPVAS